ncbi:MAG: hypothetical protein F6K19_00970 [Cyanothece sp. SIO1E1]|nr:hypothetical protein [Cyanothece sp. SIO1E1]
MPDAPEWDNLSAIFPSTAGTRQIIVADIEQVQTSCGFGVPLYEFHGQRQKLVQWAQQKGPSGLQTYQQQKNQISLDGLPTPLSKMLNFD